MCACARAFVYYRRSRHSHAGYARSVRRWLVSVTALPLVNGARALTEGVAHDERADIRNSESRFRNRGCVEVSARRLVRSRSRAHRALAHTHTCACIRIHILRIRARKPREFRWIRKKERQGWRGAAGERRGCCRAWGRGRCTFLTQGLLTLAKVLAVHGYIVDVSTRDSSRVSISLFLSLWNRAHASIALT